jgi:hypothetical protein
METTSSSPPKGPATAEALCPRCKKPLADPGGLGWCQACGYCRTLAEDRARLPLDKPIVKAKPTAAPSGSHSRPSPLWAIVLFAGIGLLALGCFAASRYFPLTPLQRAAWTSIQMLAGLAIMFAGQCYALLTIAPGEAALHFTDAIVPLRLYALVFKGLPRTALALWICSWGLTLVLSALICVGGLGHLTNYLPKSRESQQFRWN